MLIIAIEYIKQKLMELESDNPIIIIRDIVKTRKIQLPILSEDSYHMQDIRDHNNAST